MSLCDINTKLALSTQGCINNFYALCDGLSTFVEQRDASSLGELLNCTLQHNIVREQKVFALLYPRVLGTL